MNLFDTLISKIQHEEGFTINLKGESPTQGYVVALSKETEHRVCLTKDEHKIGYELQEYIKHHLVPLINGAYLGVWINHEEDEIVFDVSEVIMSLSMAKIAAWTRSQKAIWDLENNTEIYCK